MPRTSSSASGNLRRRAGMAGVGPWAGGRVPWGTGTNLPGLCLFNNPLWGNYLLEPVRSLNLDTVGLEQPRNLVRVEMVLLSAELAADFRHPFRRRRVGFLLAQRLQHRRHPVPG